METAAAVNAAEETAKNLRNFLDIYFAAAETALAAEGGASAQLGRSAPFIRWLEPADGRQRTDYDPMEIVAAEPEETAESLARALHRAKPADLLHFREGPKGWEVALGAYKLAVIRRAPRLSGKPSTVLCRGATVPGVFSTVQLVLQPEQVSLYEMYREFGSLDVYDWTDADWAGAWAREDRVYQSLWERYAKAGVVGGAPATRGVAAVVLRTTQQLGVPLLGKAAETVRAGQKEYDGRVACAADNAEQTAKEIAKALSAAGFAAEVRQLWTLLPGVEDACTWAVRLKTGAVACDVSNAPELAPLRAMPAGKALVAAAPTQLQYYAAELWTVETLERREMLNTQTATARQKEILAAMQDARKRLRHPREWTEGTLYGFVRTGVRRAGYIKADPQFPSAKS
jgi:hypothetical protein